MPHPGVFFFGGAGGNTSASGRGSAFGVGAGGGDGGGSAGGGAGGIAVFGDAALIKARMLSSESPVREKACTPQRRCRQVMTTRSDLESVNRASGCLQ